jgi:hypothetical protein
VDITNTTPGSKKIDNDLTRILWSPTYAGYGLAAAAQSEILFQRIGADASAPEPANPTACNTFDTPLGFAVSPAGAWAVAARNSSATLLVFFNPDGSHTKPDVPITGSAGPYDVIYDGSTWTTAMGSPSNIRLNRGESFNATTVVTGTLPNGGDPGLSMLGNSVLALRYKDTLYRLRRYNVPASSSSASFSAIGSTVTLVSANSANDLELRPTGSSTMLAVWQDVRWGIPNAELYAAAVDFQGCP